MSDLTLGFSVSLHCRKSFTIVQGRQGFDAQNDSDASIGMFYMFRLDIDFIGNKLPPSKATNSYIAIGFNQYWL